MRVHNLEKSYQEASGRFADLGIDTDQVLYALKQVPVSMHCWQGDDVGGFENINMGLGGGLAVTGNYPGKARTPAELRADIEMAFSLIPGKHRLNLHSFYVEFPSGKKAERNELEPAHFKSWIDWARELGIGMDFNPTLFAHPKASDGFTLAHRDKSIRKLWVEHCIACRRIGAAMGRTLGTPTVTNVWIPDGMKDTPADRRGARERLKESLDEIFAEEISPRYHLDAVEGKLFGIGSESFTVGSHEFYLAYAVANKKLLTLDLGHYHPTESAADKISSVLSFLDEILLHVSRGVRWDSDHVIILNDDLVAVAQELVRGNYLGRTHIGLDYFDASINRVAAWVIGMRNMLRALCLAMLEPVEYLKKYECSGDFTSRLALMEEARTLPVGAVWDFYCLQQNVPVGIDWLAKVKKYENDVLLKR
jgi:L-rhamnose isomerase